MKQLEVQIMGQTYLLGCPEGGDARLLEAVERVDTAMCKIRDAGKVRARDRIAVLAALNLAFDVPERAAAAVGATTTTTNAGAAAAAPSAMIDTQPAPLSGDISAEAPRPAEPASSTDSNVLLISLLERLDQALGEDGRLL